jgi:hypothetical protein
VIWTDTSDLLDPSQLTDWTLPNLSQIDVLLGPERYATKPWSDCRNFVGFVGGLVHACAREIETLEGPLQKAVLWGPHGVVHRFDYIANVIYAASRLETVGHMTQRGANTVTGKLLIAEHEAATLSDYTSKETPTRLMVAAANCAHSLMFAIENLGAMIARIQDEPMAAVSIRISDDLLVSAATLERLERAWQYCDKNPNTELTLAFEAALDAREARFAYALFDDVGHRCA